MFLDWRYAARSDVGLLRSNNQDSAYAGSNLLVVADGMGGAAGGDIASSIAVATLAALDSEGVGGEDILDALKDAIAQAHTDIVARARNDPSLSGLGTTVTAILRSGNTLAMAHIGDSRAYLLRDGALDQVTSDHSFVQHLVDTGRLSAADAENHPKRSMLLRVLGDIDADVPVDVSAREAKLGDRWLLCTDGLSSVVSRATLSKVLKGVPDPGECADQLVAFALAGGAPDNVTCIVADVVDFDQASGATDAHEPVQVVGAAASASDDAAPSAARLQVDGTPAARAAALAGPPAERRRDKTALSRLDRLRPWVLPVAGFTIVFSVSFVAYLWTQMQYYVGNDHGTVGIYRGIPQSLGPIHFSTLVAETDLELADLAAFEQERVSGAIQAASLDEAWTIVDALEAPD